MRDCTISILGTDYRIRIKKEDDRFVESDGYVDYSTKTIILQDLVNKEHEIMDMDNLEEKMMRICRHEIVHAFLFESGLDQCSTNDWAINEEMVDWIANQFEKMLKSMTVAGCINNKEEHQMACKGKKKKGGCKKGK